MFQSGTNSNLLDASRSYPGPFLPQREQIGRPFARGSMSTSKKGLLPRDFDQSLIFVDGNLFSERKQLDTFPSGWLASRPADPCVVPRWLTARRPAVDFTP
jgi:hypothetical protein